MYLVVAAKAIVVWLFGYRFPTRITQNQYYKDGKIRVWPFWVFFLLEIVLDGIIDTILGYAILKLTVSDFLYGTAHTLNQLMTFAYIIVPIVAAKRRYKVCVPVEAQNSQTNV